MINFGVFRFPSVIGSCLVRVCSVSGTIADISPWPTRIYAGEKPRQPRACGRRTDDVDVRSWCLTVVRSLREKPPDALNSCTRNIPCLANLNSKLVCQTALEALGGVNCDAARDGWQVAPFPTNSPSSPTDNHPVLSIVCINHPSASPTRRSVRPYPIQDTVTQINAVVIRVMSKLSEAGASVLKLSGN